MKWRVCDHCDQFSLGLEFDWEKEIPVGLLVTKKPWACPLCGRAHGMVLIDDQFAETLSRLAYERFYTPSN